MDKKIKLLLVYANLPMDNVIPVGISSLIASVRHPNIEVTLFDTTFYRTRAKTSDEERVKLLQVAPFNYADFGVGFKPATVESDFEKLLAEKQFDLVGISMVEATYELSCRLAAIAKRFSLPVIAGGILAILDPEFVLRDDRFDMVCVGEGERCLKAVCLALLRGDTLEGIDNLWYKDRGTIRRNKLELLSLDYVPFLDFSEYEEGRFYRPMGGTIFRMVPVEFSRGCPFNCSYCADHALRARFAGVGRWLRYKSVNRILSEIKHYLAAYQVQYFYFVSETFLAMPDRDFREFVDGYRNIKVKFWCNTRPETITEEKISLLKEIGCHRISIGIENGNEKFRKTVLRRGGATNDQIVEACAIVERHGIPFSVNNIIGFPEETRDIIFDTIKLNRRINADSYGAYMFMPYRGTDIFHYCVAKGYIRSDNLSGDVHIDSALNNPYITNEELMGLLRTFVLYVKLPELYYPEIARAEKFDDAGNAAFERLSRIYWEQFSSRRR